MADIINISPQKRALTARVDAILDEVVLEMRHEHPKLILICGPDMDEALDLILKSAALKAINKFTDVIEELLHDYRK